MKHYQVWSHTQKQAFSHGVIGEVTVEAIVNYWGSEKTDNYLHHSKHVGLIKSQDVSLELAM